MSSGRLANEARRQRSAGGGLTEGRRWQERLRWRRCASGAGWHSGNCCSGRRGSCSPAVRLNLPTPMGSGAQTSARRRFRAAAQEPTGAAGPDRRRGRGGAVDADRDHRQGADGRGGCWCRRWRCCTRWCYGGLGRDGSQSRGFRWLRRSRSRPCWRGPGCWSSPIRRGRTGSAPSASRPGRRWRACHQSARSHRGHGRLAGGGPEHVAQEQDPRCRGGRRCTAVIEASGTTSRASYLASGPGSASGGPAAGRPDRVRARSPRRAGRSGGGGSAAAFPGGGGPAPHVRRRVVVTRYSQVRCEARPSKPPSPCRPPAARPAARPRRPASNRASGRSAPAGPAGTGRRLTERSPSPARARSSGPPSRGCRLASGPVRCTQSAMARCCSGIVYLPVHVPAGQALRRR